MPNKAVIVVIGFHPDPLPPAPRLNESMYLVLVGSCKILLEKEIGWIAMSRHRVCQNKISAWNTIDRYASFLLAI